MWKSDNDSENRTAASIPLQQSCFVQYREAEEFRQAVRKDPKASKAEVRQILADRQAILQEEETFLRELCCFCAEQASAYAAEIKAFAETLPSGFFTKGNGEKDLLRLSQTLGKVRPYELNLREAIVHLAEIERRLSDLRLPAKRAEVICMMMEQTDQTKALAQKVSENTERAGRLYVQVLKFRDVLLPFTQKTLPAFLLKAKELSDLEGKGENARTGGLRSLCGEVCHAAEVFVRACNDIGKDFG